MTDMVAVACVVESSLIVASEWTRVLTEYISPLLKRLHEIHSDCQVRLRYEQADKYIFHSPCSSVWDL